MPVGSTLEKGSCPSIWYGMLASGDRVPWGCTARGCGGREVQPAVGVRPAAPRLVRSPASPLPATREPRRTAGDMHPPSSTTTTGTTPFFWPHAAGLMTGLACLSAAGGHGSRPVTACSTVQTTDRRIQRRENGGTLDEWSDPDSVEHLGENVSIRNKTDGVCATEGSC